MKLKHTKRDFKNKTPSHFVLLAHDADFRSSKGNGKLIQEYIKLLKECDEYDVSFHTLSSYPVKGGK